MTRATDGSASATSRPGRARSTPDRTRPAGARRTRSDTAAVADGDGSAAMAALRGYLMMGLPEAPLASALVEAAFLDPNAGVGHGFAAAVGVTTAAAGLFAGLGANPHRERALLAAVRFLTARRAEAPYATLALRLLDLREGGRSARRVENLPWASDDLAGATSA